MANGGDDDVELGNIQDPAVEFLLRSTQIKQHNEFSPTSMGRIPSEVLGLTPSAFKPRVVSIGPLHRGNDKVESFQRQKDIFLRDLVASSPKNTLAKCVQKIKASVERIRSCYEYRGWQSYSDENIAIMMVMDACFILEFIYKLSKGDFDENMVLAPSIIYDLLLIENQIPFFVLQDIFECTRSRFEPAKITSLNGLVLVLLEAVNIFQSKLRIKEFNKAPDHILGLLHEYYKPLVPPSVSPWSFLEISHSAVELDRGGVNFKPHNSSSEEWWPMDIKLESPGLPFPLSMLSSIRIPVRYVPWYKPSLRIPVLHIEGDTDLVLRNLIAYEQLSPDIGNYVTSYVTAMDLLINNADDVAILVESQVLVNRTSSNEEAAEMINKLGKVAPFRQFLYANQWRELHDHQMLYWPKNIQWFKRTYCLSPWNMLALLAGILLFVLTIIQTYYTINPVQTNS